MSHYNVGADGKNPQENPRFNGAAIVAGNPGNSGGKKGRSGRKTLEFVKECGALADREVLPKLAKCLREKGPAALDWRWAAETVLKYGKAKPAEQIAPPDPELRVVWVKE